MDNISRLNRIGEAALTASQKRRARALSKQGLEAEQIASVLNINEECVDELLTERERGINTSKLFQKQLGPIPACTPERWAKLVAAKDRDGLIVQAGRIISKRNSKTLAYVKDDCEAFAFQQVVGAVDHCLATGMDSAGVAAYIYATVVNAIGNARKGKHRQYVGTNVRTSQPVKRTNRELENRLRQSGLSESMVESELFSAGYQPCGKTRKAESQWPEALGDLGMQAVDFAGNASGKHHGGKSLETWQPAADDWRHLEETLSTEQCDYLRLKAAGFTNDEIAERYGVPIQDQYRIIAKIKAKLSADSE